MSLTTALSQLSNWLGSLWRGNSYALLERELVHERAERKREYDALWKVFLEERQKSEEEIKRLNDDRVLLSKGVFPAHLRPPAKPTSTREIGYEGAMREAREAKAAQQAEMTRKAEEWKRANLNHNDPTEKIS